MKLNKLYKCDYDIDIDNISDDSREIKKNGLFIAVKGLSVNGNKYIDKAIENGAVAVVTDEDIKCSVPVIKVNNSNCAYNEILNNYYDDVLNKIKIIAVTGTDGKTTVTEIIYQLMNYYTKTGYIGTNGIRTTDWSCDNHFTTPLPKDLFRVLDEFVKHKVSYVAMEASSERLGTGKLDGVSFCASIFTNLTRDNLNVHKDMNDYAKAKAKCFKATVKDGPCIVFKDDKYSDVFINSANGVLYTYGYNSDSDVYPSNIVVSKKKLEFDIHGILGDKHIETGLSGEFNVLNLMAVLLLFNHFSYDIDDVIEKIKLLKPIAARQLFVECGQPFDVIVDYAHTANAIKNLVTYVKTFNKNRVIVVVGAAGARDIGRRVETADYCVNNVDYSIFTLDDPWSEDPTYLLDSMVQNVKDYKNYELEQNRDMAIKKALDMANPGDAVLILGKGLENYLKMKDKDIFRKNDYEFAKDYLNKKYNKIEV